jgi:hypothetical protein
LLYTMNGGRDEAENERSIRAKPACTVLDGVPPPCRRSADLVPIAPAPGSGAGRAPVK